MSKEGVTKLISRVESVIEASRIEQENSYVEIMGALIVIILDLYQEIMPKRDEMEDSDDDF